MDLQSTFTKAQAYVMLGRTENLQQIYLADFDNGKLGCNTNSLVESQSLEKKAEQHLNENVWLSNADLFRVSHLNIRSLKSAPPTWILIKYLGRGLIFNQEPLALGVEIRAHNLCHNNRQLIVLAINRNHSASKNNCN